MEAMHEKKNDVAIAGTTYCSQLYSIGIKFTVKKKLCKNVHCVKGLKFTTSCIQTLAKCDCRQLYM